jgi:gluconolactonase
MNTIYIKITLFTVLCSLCLNHSAGQSSPAKSQKLLSKGAQPKKISSSFSFTEGPAADRIGNVYFTDQPNDRIMKWATDGSISTFMEPSGRSNGLYFDRSGNLFACADAENQLWKIGPDKKVEIMLKDYDGKHLNGPNDLWIDLRGNIYFTDPYYKRDYWKHTGKDLNIQGVYLFIPAQQKLILLDGDLMQPNGIIGTPDGKQLYVSDINNKKNVCLSNKHGWFAA